MASDHSEQWEPMAVVVVVVVVVMKHGLTHHFLERDGARVVRVEGSKCDLVPRQQHRVHGRHRHSAPCLLLLVQLHARVLHHCDELGEGERALLLRVPHVHDLPPY